MIEQLTPVDQPRLDAWYRRAINDPKVRNHMFPSPYRPSRKVIPDNDWDAAYFMRKGDDSAVLELHPDHIRKTMSMNLFCIDEGRGTVVAASSLLRYALTKAPRRFEAKVLTFATHASNKEWNRGLRKMFPGCCWGVEPQGMWNCDTGLWEDRHCYRVDLDTWALRNFDF